MNGIYVLKEKMMSSPLREYLNEDVNIPFKDMISNQLYSSMERFKVISESESDPLKIVIVGEVKSGKSSLINALIKSKVSEVDVLESTSNIIEVIYGKEEYIQKDEQVVKVSIDKEYLKKINIVDTPGLRSITIDNEKTTLNYIKNADLILFVIDATHIGQEDIIDALDIISEYNKEIIGVINKCDLLQENKENVLEFVKDEYGIYIEQFFMISAYLEYQDIISKNAIAKGNDLIISENTDIRREFMKLNDYIQIISSSSEKLKLDSIKSSIESITQKEIVIHYDYLKNILVLIDQIKKYEELIENKYDYMKFKMDFEINEWVNRIFLVEELSKIKENIENSNIYINESYINDIINSKKSELDQLFFKEWNECLKEVSEALDEDIKNYMDKFNYKNEFLDTPNFDVGYNNTDLNDILTTVGTGAILGATSGGIISIYSASIGTSAATITLSSALMTYFPPLLIAGTVTGALAKIINDKIKLEKKHKEILKDIDNYINEIKYEISEVLKDGYNNCGKEIVITTSQVLSRIKNIFLSKYELENLSSKIEDYIKILQEDINY